MERKDELTLLGSKTEYRQDYAPEVLESFVNKHPGNDYWVRFNCPEFTSLPGRQPGHRSRSERRRLDSVHRRKGHERKEHAGSKRKLAGRCGYDF